MTTIKRDVGGLAGAAGAVAATCAALCCAGAPIILSILAATGLSFLRSDAILLPVIAIALLFALWGFWRSSRVRGSRVPLALGFAGSLTLVAGVIYLHGFLAKLFIGTGTLLLLAATVWNARLPQTCDLPMALTRSSE
jgi:O-antigen ligase